MSGATLGLLYLPHLKGSIEKRFILASEQARKAVAPDRLALQNKYNELDRAWDDFVIQRETWTPEQRERLEEMARSRLEAKDVQALFEQFRPPGAHVAAGRVDHVNIAADPVPAFVGGDQIGRRSE